jgi:CheY-like chemotaxis protein
MIETLAFDTILMDVELPVLGGFATKAVRKMPGERFRELVILALTTDLPKQVRELPDRRHEWRAHQTLFETRF